MLLGNFVKGQAYAGPEVVKVDFAAAVYANLGEPPGGMELAEVPDGLDAAEEGAHGGEIFNIEPLGDQCFVCNICMVAKHINRGG